MKHFIRHPFRFLLPFFFLFPWLSHGQTKKIGAGIHLKSNQHKASKNTLSMTIGGDTISNAKTLIGNWKFHKGDNRQWALPQFEDSQWRPLRVSFLNLDSLTREDFNGIGWFRREFTLDSSLVDRSLMLNAFQFGASQIYINGELITELGKVSPDPGKEKVNAGIFRPVPVQFSHPGPHHIAVRYSDNQAWQMKEGVANKNGTGFFIWMVPTERFMEIYNALLKRIIPLLSLVLGIGGTITIIHLLLFLFYRNQPANLYYSLYMGFSSIIILVAFSLVVSENPHLFVYTTNYIPPLLPLIIPALLGVFYSVFYKKVSPFGIGIFVLALLSFAMYFFHVITYGILFGISSFLALIDILRVLLMAFLKRKPGTKIFGYTFLAVFFIIGLFTIRPAHFFEADNLLLISSIFTNFYLSFFVGIPVSMSVYLAWGFADTNRSLNRKLIEVQELSEQNLQHEREKQKIIEDQKEELEKKVEERTQEVVHQKEQIQEKNQEITDSITYAKRIQDALLPPETIFEQHFPEGFVLFKPQSIVSGDFYWLREVGDKVFFASCDCTGHGVPGAFMSMIGNQLLNEVIGSQGETDPGKAFDRVRDNLVETLQKQGREGQMKDGMDATLAVLDKKRLTLQGVGANNPVYLLREHIGEALPPVTYFRNKTPVKEDRVIPFKKSPHGIEIKGDKQSIGYEEGKNAPFTTFSLSLQKGDVIYLFSDGYADQFGGPKGKKFRYGPFKKLLAEIRNQPMAQQKELLHQTFEAWKDESNQEQVDDVCVVGVRM